MENYHIKLAVGIVVFVAVMIIGMSVYTSNDGAYSRIEKLKDSRLDCDSILKLKEDAYNMLNNMYMLENEESVPAYTKLDLKEAKKALPPKQIRELRSFL